MSLDFYETILKELSESLAIKELKPDKNNSCLIHFDNELEIQIEPYEAGEQLLISAQIAELPPGKFRTNVFQEALKANSAPYPRQGTFGYSIDTNTLILFKLMPYENLTGDKIAAYLTPFMEKAVLWREGIEKGEIPHVTVSAKNKPPPLGMFGGLT